jgi:putative intracellular protease/amidase
MNILMVLTSHNQLDDTGEKTGLWLEEFTTPYYVFRDAGANVALASPEGGEPPVDPKSQRAENEGSSVRRFRRDPVAQAEFVNTRKLNAVSAADFDAVFYPGGHGPMWDLPENTASIGLIENFVGAEKPVAAVCHGPAALVNVRGKDGDYLVKGKRVTGFTDAEEEAVGLASTVPFLLEDRLSERGAIFREGPDWASHVEVDGKLVTGQNPASAGPAAEALLKLLGGGWGPGAPVQPMT